MNEVRSFYFPRFRIDPANQQLWRDNEIVPVRPKTFRILLYLIQNPQRLISRQELIAEVWPENEISANLLRTYVWELRQVLGDTAKPPHYIETVNRRGYRFLPRVSAESPNSNSLAEHTLSARERPEEAGDAAAIHSRNENGRPSDSAIRIGVLHSLTGTMAYSESPVVDATLLAIDEINHRGGLLGQRIEPLVVDGRSDGEIFAREAECLLETRDVAAIFGCWMSAHRKKVVPVVERHKSILIYPVQYEGMELSSNVFHTGAAPNQQIIPAIRWAFGFLNCKRLFLVGSDYIFPRVANQIIRDQLDQIGGTVVGEVYIAPGAFEIKDLAARIATANAELIVNTINGDSNIAFFRTLRTAGITADRIPTLSFSIGENELRNLDIAGTYASWNYFQSIKSPENIRFVDSFHRRYGPQRVTSDPMEAAYIGVHLWAQAVLESGTAEPSRIRETLPHQSFNAPEGLVRMDSSNQHTWKTIRLGRVLENGQFEVTYSSERPIQPEPFPATRSRTEWTALLESFNTPLQR